MQHLKQPTRTSCGPTCVAMLVNAPVSDVLAALPAIRTEQRQSMRRHSTNVGELSRLLARYGFQLDFRRRQQWDGGEFGLLRVHHRRESGSLKTRWHWVALANGRVFDPSLETDLDVETWSAETRDHVIYLYEVTRKD